MFSMTLHEIPTSFCSTGHAQSLCLTRMFPASKSHCSLLVVVKAPFCNQVLNVEQVAKDISAATKLVPSTVAARQWIRGSNPMHPLSTSSISLATRRLCYLFVKSPERDFNHVSAIEPCENEMGALSSIHALTAFNLRMAVAFKFRACSPCCTQ